MIALYRFWPDARKAVAITAQRGVASPAPAAAAALPLGELTSTRGAYDLAVEIGEPCRAHRAGSRALGLAEAILAGRLWRAGGQWVADVSPPVLVDEPEPDTFASVGSAVPLLLLRAKGGWNLVAAPDRETWLTLSMTFLNRQTYQRFDHEAAWHSPDVNELASLVLGTHNTQDVEGTCLTYGIPGLSLRDWSDAVIAASTGGPPEGTRSALLAEQLHYAALLRAPATGTASLREALAPLGSDLFLVPPS